MTENKVRAHLYGLGKLKKKLKNSTNRLNENRELVKGGETTRVGELSRLGR